MKRLYEKNEVTFAIALILVYVFGSTAMGRLSEKLGTEFLAEVIFSIVLFAMLAIFIRRNGLARHLGLCKPELSARMMLYYIPLPLIAGVGVIFGPAPQYAPAVLAVHTVQMLFVGFLEEVIFRGFLFRGMARSNKTAAIIVSSLTFGMGHIVNLLNGYELTENLMQIVYAVGVGFLLVFIFIRTGSLIPCIAFHSLNNMLSGFGSYKLLIDLAGSERGGLMLNVAIRILLTGAYLIYVLKATPREDRLK